MVPNPHASLADVAARCGVSPSTASRVLNNYTTGFSVRDEVRRRILAAAAELHYLPNPLLRTLRAKRTGMIAVLGMDRETLKGPGVIGHVVHALIWSLHEAGISVSANFLAPGQERFSLPRWRVDGAAITDPVDAATLAAFDAIDLPYVTINGVRGVRGSSVEVDDTDATRQAMAHLMGLGHRRIAYINIPAHADGAHVSVASRELAYIAAMTEAGYQPLPDHHRLHAGTGELMDAARRQGATAVLAYDHQRSIEIYRWAHQAGFSIPDDLSLISFNDDPVTRVVEPAVTVISLPAAAMGAEAARLLRAAIDDGERGRSTVLQAELIVRGSTAAPRT